MNPGDPHDAELLANAHPEDWPVPEPAGRYNLVVVGGGTAGLIAALGAAGLGGRVALVERRLLGGDCLNFGCVPSKALLAEAHRGGAFAAAAERMRRLRAKISHHDSAERLKRDGIDVFLGDARFTGPDTVEVAGRTLTFARACVATGARPLVPPIPGVEETRVRTNEDLFDLTELPRRLAVVGAGPIGCEMAQAFRRFGSEVTLIDQADRILPAEEPEASALLADVLRAEGIEIRTGAKVERLSPGTVHLAGEDVEADEILLALGRVPNVEGLGLEAAGVAFDRQGVTVDDHLRTTNPRIYASGDVCSRFKFTHAADAMSRIVIQNALFFGRKRASALTIPWVTYTDPEIAHVGVAEGLSFTARLEDNDRSLLEGEAGTCTVHCRPDGTILGATIVGRHAGELIAPVVLAMSQGLGLSAFVDAVLPYPTRSQVLSRVAGEWRRTKLTPFNASVLRSILRWRR